MVYTFIFKDRSYDLPTKTLSIMKKMERVVIVDQSDIPIEEKYQEILNFIEDLIGKRAMIEIFDTDDINEIDLSELTIVFLSIKDAYEKQINEYRANMQSQILNDSFLEKITKLSSTMEYLNSATKNNA